MSYITQLALSAKQAQSSLANASVKIKNQILTEIALALQKNSAQIIAENKIDLDNAKQNGMSAAMLDRLMLDEHRIESMVNGIKKVLALPDPIGEVLSGMTMANGMKIVKRRVALGVIGIIYESRPNVTVDSTVLCLKASNALVLRGGKEAIHSNRFLAKLMKSAVELVGLDSNIIGFVDDTSREVTTEMMQLNGIIDVLIPRGGAGLIQAVVKNATVPVIETGVGNCHVYIDSFADLEMGANIVNNAKTSRPSVCNACESLLVHADVAKEFLPMAKIMLDRSNVRLLGCSKTIEILGDSVIHATAEDYATEFNDYTLSLKVVDSMQQAIDHIAKYSTHHSEAIVTSNLQNATIFTDMVDAAAVYVNASTRFTDGEEFGLGAEIGISTQKLHVRGPMGLKELTSTKYIIHGDGNIR